MRRIYLASIIVLSILAMGCIEQDGQKSGVLGASAVPDGYYFSFQTADINSPIEVIRFADSISPHASGLTISERVAFFEWYFKNSGFNVSFVSSDNFASSGRGHVWLMVTNKMGERMSLEPSYDLMKAEIAPTDPWYKSYQKQYGDIYDLVRSTGGSSQYAWWNTPSGKDLWSEDVVLLKKRQLS